jgi:hypothetical protein
MTTPDGSRTLGHVDADERNGIVGSDIWMNVGVPRHAEKRHAAEIRKFGYQNALDMSMDVLSDYTEIREGTEGSLLLVKRAGREEQSPAIAVRLDLDDDGVYKARNAFFLDDYLMRGNRRKLLSTKRAYSNVIGSDPDLALPHAPKEEHASPGRPVNPSERALADSAYQESSSDGRIPPRAEAVKTEETNRADEDAFDFTDEEQVRDSAAKVRDDVKRQLVEAGVAEEEAEANGDLMAAAMTGFARREGLSPEAFYKRLGLTFVRDEVTGETYLQTAYHGTPHRGIKKMSLQKIGSGEGRQAYGWGIYSAENRGIAEHYYKVLSEVRPKVSS